MQTGEENFFSFQLVSHGSTVDRICIILEDPANISEKIREFWTTEAGKKLGLIWALLGLRAC